MRELRGGRVLNARNSSNSAGCTSRSRGKWFCRSFGPISPDTIPNMAAGEIRRPRHGRPPFDERVLRLDAADHSARVARSAQRRNCEAPNRPARSGCGWGAAPAAGIASARPAAAGQPSWAEEGRPDARPLPGPGRPRGRPHCPCPHLGPTSPERRLPAGGRRYGGRAQSLWGTRERDVPWRGRRTRSCRPTAVSIRVAEAADPRPAPPGAGVRHANVALCSPPATSCQPGPPAEKHPLLTQALTITRQVGPTKAA
ncbi:hypothetical protein EES45_31690 [Streptomyces sp. ADI97-07]|nr:hypothetical protein EES45_31690 [Streptomyces sp. ADI97-07]